MTSTSCVSCSTGRRGRAGARRARNPQIRNPPQRATRRRRRLGGFERRARFVLLAELEQRGAKQQVRVVEPAYPALGDAAADDVDRLGIVPGAVEAEPDLHVDLALGVL